MSIIIYFFCDSEIYKKNSVKMPRTASIFRSRQNVFSCDILDTTRVVPRDDVARKPIRDVTERDLWQLLKEK